MLEFRCQKDFEKFDGLCKKIGFECESLMRHNDCFSYGFLIINRILWIFFWNERNFEDIFEYYCQKNFEKFDDLCKKIEFEYESIMQFTVHLRIFDKKS